MLLSRVTSSLNDAPFRVVERVDVTDTALSTENRLLTQEVTRLRLRMLELQRAADTDPLLPIYNRRAFMREVSRAQTVASRYDIESALIFFDLNGFKGINDQFGHSSGDILLKTVGDILQSGVRDCDMVARLGGDEFGVLLFKSSVEIAQAKAATLSCRISQEIVKTPAGAISVSTAWGAALCDPTLTAEAILEQADRAMYEAKRKLHA